MDWPQPAPTLTARLEDDHVARQDAFWVAHDALGSSVDRRDLSVYDLSLERAGMFDFAFMGTLLHHLRDPVGALMAVRGVLRGSLLCHEVIAPWLSLLRPRAPTPRLMARRAPFWWIPNRAALHRMIEAAGFRILQAGGPHLLRYGAGRSAPPLLDPARRLHGVGDRLMVRFGVPHVWAMAAPIAPAAAADQP